MNREERIIADLEERQLLWLARRVATQHRVTIEEMVSDYRMQPIVAARHAFMLALREMRTEAGESYSLPYIARILRMDHTSVLSGVRKARERAAQKASVA